jgi:5-methyltetrahydrofolate--homocysteine methyltransferase
MLSEVLKRGIIVFDGAMGTRLQKLGLPAGHPPEEWNLSHPEEVARIHRSYVEAGSTLIQTNTFGANRIRLERYHLEEKIKEIIHEGVVLKEGVLLSASIGPLGEFIEPYGDLSLEKAQRAFMEQVELLQEEGIKIFHLETFSFSSEALLAWEAIKHFSGEAIVSFTFEKRGEGHFTTLMGEHPRQIVEIFKDEPITALGTNCGGGIREITGIARQYRESYLGPLSCKPNAGIPQVVEEKVIYTETPEDFAEGAKQLLKLGVNIIGGCCGTDERYITAVKRVIEEMSSFKP